MTESAHLQSEVLQLVATLREAKTFSNVAFSDCVQPCMHDLVSRVGWQNQLVEAGMSSW